MTLDMFLRACLAFRSAPRATQRIHRLGVGSWAYLESAKKESHSSTESKIQSMPWRTPWQIATAYGYSPAAPDTHPVNQQAIAAKDSIVRTCKRMGWTMVHSRCLHAACFSRESGSANPGRAVHPFCLSVCCSFCLSIGLSVCISVSLSGCPSVCRFSRFSLLSRPMS